MSNTGKKSRISIRITPNQELVLQEMSEALDTTYSMLIRTIIGNWLAEHEEAIYKLVDKKKLEHAKNKKNGEEKKSVSKK